MKLSIGIVNIFYVVDIIRKIHKIEVIVNVNIYCSSSFEKIQSANFDLVDCPSPV